MCGCEGSRTSSISILNNHGYILINYDPSELQSKRTCVHLCMPMHIWLVLGVMPNDFPTMQSLHKLSTDVDQCRMGWASTHRLECFY